MQGKAARVDFETCDARTCAPENGRCAAVEACTKKLLEQDEPYDSPMLLSAVMCVACGDCVRVCRLEAVTIKRTG